MDPWFTTVQAQRRIESLFSGERYHKQQTQVPLSQVSKNLQHAVIASEDARFYQHRGVDWEILEKLVEEDIEEGKITRGGSTITQQLVKNLFATTHRTYWRKALELTLAPVAEMILSKQRILELYLNNIEWGSGVFGAEAAADFYYRTTASKLTRDQASRLAVCIPAPRKRKPSQMGKTASIVLHRMDQMTW